MRWQNIMRRVLLALVLVCSPLLLSAQLTYGTTGLLHMPSAEMQRDKTVMIGANYLNEAITPRMWTYGTYNYYLSATIFPWMEVAYTMTLFKGYTLGLHTKHFTNQDRYFSLRIRALEEGQFWKYMPAVVFGTSDPYVFSSENIGSKGDVNGYFSRFYVAATKHVSIGSEEIGVHLAYLYNMRDNDYPLNGPAFGLSYNPSFLPQVSVIAEYDSKDFAVGAMVLLFNHLHMQFEMQRMERFTGGLAYKIYLK